MVAAAIDTLVTPPYTLLLMMMPPFSDAPRCCRHMLISRDSFALPLRRHARAQRYMPLLPRYVYATSLGVSPLWRAPLLMHARRLRDRECMLATEF